MGPEHVRIVRIVRIGLRAGRMVGGEVEEIEDDSRRHDLRYLDDVEPLKRWDRLHTLEHVRKRGTLCAREVRHGEVSLHANCLDVCARLDLLSETNFISAVYLDIHREECREGMAVLQAYIKRKAAMANGSLRSSNACRLEAARERETYDSIAFICSFEPFAIEFAVPLTDVG